MVGANYERKLKEKLTNDHWLVVRSAGSHGADLVAVQPMMHMIIEVKSTSKDRFKTNINQQSKEQFDMLNSLAMRGFTVYYYIWFKRKCWCRYQLPKKAYPTFTYEEGEQI